MFDILLLLLFASVLNWGVTDIYFYSVIFDPIRSYADGWHTSRGLLRLFRYMLGCPFCFSHWSAAVILAVLSAAGYAGCLPVVLHPVFALISIPAAARVSMFIRDWSYPPVTNIAAPEITETAETEQDNPAGIEIRPENSH